MYIYIYMYVLHIYIWWWQFEKTMGVVWYQRFLSHKTSLAKMCTFVKQTCVCVYVYIYIYICMYVCVCMYVYVYISFPIGHLAQRLFIRETRDDKCVCH
jgi:hypothetical protein